MVFGNLVENRICYKSDGPSGGGDSNRGVERGRTNQPPAAAGRNFSQGSNNQSNRDDNSPRDTMLDIVTLGNPAANTIPSQTSQRDELEIQNFVESMPTGSSTAAPSGGRIPARSMTDRQMLAASAGAPNPFAAPSGGGIPAGSMPGSGNAEQAAIVNALVNNAARQSYANGGTDARNTVQGAPGRRDAESGFFADVYDQLYRDRLDDGFPDPDAAPVTAPGTAIGSILSGGILGNLFNAPDAADSAAFNLGQMQRLAQTSQTGTVDPKTGAVTGVQAGPGTLSMNALGGVVYSGMNDPNYSGPFESLVRGTAGNNRGSGDNRQSNNQMAAQQPDAPVDPGTTTPEQIDDLAVNYLQNPYYLYSGQDNLFQPYGYAGGTLVDLLQTRNMRMPGQAAPDLGLFGNPRDFS